MSGLLYRIYVDREGGKRNNRLFMCAGTSVYARYVDVPGRRVRSDFLKSRQAVALALGDIASCNLAFDRARAADSRDSQ